MLASDAAMRTPEVEKSEDAAVLDGQIYDLELPQSGGAEDVAAVCLVEVVAGRGLGWEDWGWDVAGRALPPALVVIGLGRRGFERCLVEGWVHGFLGMVLSHQG